MSGKERARPGGAIAGRPLQFFWVADCSSSMSVDGKIQSLNQSVRDALPATRDVAKANPEARVLMRAVKFSDGAQWHVPTPTPVDDFEWEDLAPYGLTSMGKALEMVASELETDTMDERGYPPVIVLVSDGQPTDDFKGGLHSLNQTRWGQKAVRMAVGIGEDVDTDVLEQFIGNPEIPVLVARNSSQLASYIRFVSTVALSVASKPKSKVQGDAAGASAFVVPPAPAAVGGDVW